LEDKGIQLGELFANMPKVQQYFAEGKRTELYNELVDLYKVQNEKYGIEEAHFAVPPATSFLRMRDINKFGDDLSYKPQVLGSNSEKISKKGVALSRTGPVIYGVVPINDTTGNFVGCVQVDLKFDPILEKLKATYNIELSLLINEKQLVETSTSLGGDIVNSDNRLGAYIKCYSTNWELMKNLITDNDIAASDGIIDPFVRNFAKISYGVLIYPLKDYNDNLMGYMVVASDFSSSRSQADKTILMFITLSVFAIVFLIGFVIIILKGGLIRPLRMLVEHFEALASGNKEMKMEDTSKYYQEIQQLAQNYETLRTQSDSNEITNKTSNISKKED